ncbi:MAG: hypothetical protein E4H18_05540 [Hyphomicrobiales bacterium]|nr:MAG: hypothetical protein E4H18_05540 [Hyphomicrobiales bacterium]
MDPVTGEFAGGASPGETRSFNSVWDASEGKVALVAARGEIAAFQVAVEASAGPLEDVTLALEDLTGGHASIGASGIRIYREWYVKPHRAWVADYAIPLDAAIPIPYPPNGVTGQRVQSFWIDIHVPKAAAPGTYTGALTVSAAGVADAVLEVEIEVCGAVLPDEMTFWAELNGYGAPGGAGTPYYYDAHRIAHYNRCCINIVPYDQGPDGDQEYRPQIEGTGAATRVVDWSEFDAVQGPLLDGSAFAGLPRDGVALRVFYLPFYEYWPAPFLENYDWGQPPSAETLNLNYLGAPPIEEAVSEDFKAAWRSVVPEFVDHFRAMGWTHTIFECYTNNKWHMAGTMFWNLDEPAVREDYRAIRFFGRLFKDALGDPGEIQMLFRGDISRPQWQFDDFNGIMDIEYVNTGVVDMVRSVQEANRRAGSRFVVYGHANEITRSNFETVQWCLTSYLCGADGVLPWNSFDATDAFTRGSRNGLIIDGAPAGHRGPVASLRVFAFRRGVQDVEILKMLAAKKGWTADQMAVFINAFVPLGSDFTQAFTDEAAAATYEAAGAAGFVALRKAALDAL